MLPCGVMMIFPPVAPGKAPGNLVHSAWKAPPGVWWSRSVRMVKDGALLAYGDLRDLPDDGRRYELLDGALVVTPAPGSRHQVIVGALYRLLWAARPSGTTVMVSPIDFVPRPDTVLQPVVVFELAGSAYQEVARVAGTDRYDGTTPFPVAVVPDLLHEV